MATYNAGVLISEMRTQKKITQDKLCAGICDRRTLAYIESGKTSPTKFVFEKLMERLEIDHSRFSNYISNKTEMKFEMQKLRINGLFKRYKYSEIQMHLDELKDDPQFFGNKFVKQYILITEAWLLGGGDEWVAVPFDRIHKLLHEAICITIPDFIDENISGLYSLEEISIIRLIGACYLFNKNPESALVIFLKLSSILETEYIVVPDRAELYASLTVATCKAYRYLKRYDEAYKTAENGLKFCSSTQSYRALPWIIYQKADAAFYLGNLEESKLLFEDSMRIFEYYEETETLEFVRDRMSGKFSN